jgi:predicted signal transduction protein with EAL and GGDEF domain
LKVERVKTILLVEDSPGDVRLTQETQEELAFLQAHQCDEAQGYFFSRPVPPQDFAILLQTQC